MSLSINDFIKKLKVKKKRVSIRLFDKTFINDCINNIKGKSYNKQSEFALFLKILLFRNSVSDDFISYKFNNQIVMSNIENKNKIIERLNEILCDKLETFREMLKLVIELAQKYPLAKKQIKHLILVLTRCEPLKNIRCDLGTSNSIIKLNFDNTEVVEQIPSYNNLGTLLNSKFGQYLTEYMKPQDKNNLKPGNGNTITFENKEIKVDELDSILKDTLKSAPSYANIISNFIKTLVTEK